MSLSSHSRAVDAAPAEWSDSEEIPVTRYDLVQLKCPLGHFRSVRDHIEKSIAGKSALEVGAVGTICDYLPDRISSWPHARYAKAAREIDIIDIDRRRIEIATRLGFRASYGDCEEATLKKRYDAIIMVDVIEHLEQPARALVNLAKHLSEGGALFVTTQNAGYAGDVLRALLNRAPHVYWDHMTLMAPEHIQAMCDRHRLVLRSIYFYSEIDHRSVALRAKSRLLRIAAGAAPRLSQSFLAEIGKP
jgi:2-polyprenyl-3-methyl-5-hydroxy-6-metoxy-1,4-benzoquinol methylase